MKIKHKYSILLLVALLLLFAGCSSTKKAATLPPISQEAIDTATQEIKDNPEVREANIEVNNDEIYLSIIVGAGTEKEKAQDLGENYARLLATYAAEGQLKPPAGNSLGDLYKFYTLEIGVGTGPYDFIAQGVKLTDRDTINW